MKSQILIVDFGSQFTQLIARRVRESGVYCEIYPYHHITVDRIQQSQVLRGLILSGGPSSVMSHDSPRLSDEIWTLGLPILGICYGQQLMCSQLGGRVESHDYQEFGLASLEILDNCPLFDQVWTRGQQTSVCMSHGDQIRTLPNGFRNIARTPGTPYAAIVDDSRGFYGLQFHPEASHTPEGKILIENFLFKICHCIPDWTLSSFKEASIRSLREKIGAKKVICALSGGVDSLVTAVLLHQAIGSQLTCIFVDNGLLRNNDKTEVEKLFQNHYPISLIIRDASQMFLDHLKDISDPEQKRKIIGKLFIDVFEEESQKMGGSDFLAQGTLYPDIIESVCPTSSASPIKSHHNVGGLPEKMKMPLIEPLATLFKDEVRLLGKELGIPPSHINRHPFPGPGLAIRIMGSVDRQKCDLLRLIDAIYLEEIERAGLYDTIWQAFAILLPIKTVGVMGDKRTYEYVCALRAVISTDGMTADVYPFDPRFLTYLATRLVNEVRGINRVVYDYTSKPPGTIEWE